MSNEKQVIEAITHLLRLYNQQRCPYCGGRFGTPKTDIVLECAICTLPFAAHLYLNRIQYIIDNPSELDEVKEILEIKLPE